MNSDVMQARWTELRREAHQRWNKLTDEDLDHTTGQLNQLVDLVEERYGISRQKAQRQVEKFMRDYGDSIQETASSWMQATQDFFSDRPWAGVLTVLLLVALVAGLIVRPNMRDW